MDISSNYLYSFSKHIKQRGQTSNTLVSQQWLEQQETETIKVRHHHTRAETSRWPVQHLVAIFYLPFAFICWFSSLLIASLPHLRSRWDKRTNEIRSLCVVERSSDSRSDKNSSQLTDCLSAGVPTFRRHEGTTVSKKHPKFTNNQLFSLSPVLFCRVDSKAVTDIKPNQ